MSDPLRFNNHRTHRLPFPGLLLGLLAVLIVSSVLPAAASGEVVELPQTVMPQLDAPAVIERDIDGIPHINAATEHDLFFLQGWIHAEDRLFQMDVNRRQPSGTLAVLFGTPALASDVELRTLGLARAAEASLPALSERTRAALQAYADGVNAWVASHPLPVEYTALELGFFTPWRPVDSVVIGKAIAFGLSFDLDIGLTETLLTYQATGEAAGFDGLALFFQDLFRSAPFDAASTLPDAGAEPPALIPLTAGSRATASDDGLSRMVEAARQGLEKIDPVARSLSRNIVERMSKVPMLQSALDPRERIQGSNEWAVSGALTTSGRPLIANDPHLALNTPSTFYQIHLRSPQERLDVMGSGFPGVPFVILGQNNRLAWGATTNPMDVTDTYLEQIVPDAASPSRLSIIHEGQREHILDLPQTFFYNQPGNGVPNDIQTADPGKVVAGVFIPSSVFIVPRRNNGPLLDFDLDTNTAISVQYAGFGPTREVEAFRVWNRARNLEEFIAGLQLFDVGSQNWVVGDVFGNIAYFTSGEMPIREDLQAGTVNGLPPFFIRDGSGGNEWLPVENPQPEQALPFEILPFSEMPQLINPPAGWFVNANNDPVGTTLDNDPLNQLRPGGGLYYLNPGYASGFRAGSITRLLRDRLAVGPVSAEDMAAIQADVSLLDARVLVPEIVAAFNRADSAASPALIALAADPAVAGVVGRLSVWDYTTPTGIPQGFDADGIDGLRFPPDNQAIQSSVAATVYSVWRGQVLRRTIDAALEPLGLPGPGSAQAMSALRHLLDTFPQNQGFGASGLDFFPAPAGTSRSNARDLALLGALRDALDLLAGPAFDTAFGGSTNIEDYRWGRLHRIVLDHPLGPPFSIPPAFDGFPNPLGDTLPGIPVDGGFGVVDASSHSARADSANDFMFGSGPVRRYVAEPGGPGPFINARTSLPGGESGVPGSPFYANLLPRWLTNDSYPVRQAFNDYQPVVVQRMRFVPPSDP